MAGNVKLLIREVNQKDESIVQTYDKSILVTNLKVPETQNGDSRQRIRRFAVDFCYDPKYPESCTQESVYQDVGKEILDSMFDGYNACVLAYGHSASGKTYTMMGEEDDPGLTPRICRGLFRRMSEKALTTRVRFHTVVSFLEIYNERVRDLLVSDESAAAAAATAGGNFSLRVREHPKLGPYVQDLSQHIVNDEERILEYLAVGNSRRSTAATENNVHSSRSHAVFTIRFKQTDEPSFESELSSKVHLVDLAGSLQETSPAQLKKSERAGSTQSKTRLKEGANINKSLVTLGNVISALAESCETFTNPRDQPVTKTWQPFVPYRDSVLTWLLKDTLGGNSNTIMIATVSPASSCLNETINTLRYAKRTKRIVNQPIVNEDPKIRTIKELREEIEKLRSVILSLQINSPRLAGEDSPSKSGEKEGDADECIGSKEESLVSGQNEGDPVGDGESDAISVLDILPDLGAAGEGGKVEANGGSHRVAGVKGASANSFAGDVCKINDEKGADVNGSVIDKLIRESQVFPGNLESFSVPKTENHGDFGANDGVESAREACNFVGSGDLKPRKRRLTPCRAHRDNQSVPKISRTSKLGICSRRHARHRLKLYLRRECNSLESLLTRSHAKMLHRSRPDLIKGISSHSKEGLPSTSSQSFTDVSGLSQSASENSLNSSGSVDSQAFDAKERGKAPDEGKMRKISSRQSSLGDGSGSSTPTQIPKAVPKRRADKRSEIVAAVTTRLYATKKKPDPRMEALQAAEKEEDDDGELEELKLCKRARMKLFDLSRKLAMAKRIKKTMDSDTQTDFLSGTVRVKEKCVVTDQSGVVQYENCGTNTPTDKAFKKEKDHPIIMNQVFIPRYSDYVVECGKNVRVEVPAARPAGRDSGTQTVDSYQTSLPQPNEEHFSDDSLEDEGLVKCRKDCEMDSLEMSPVNKSGVKSQSNENVTTAKESSGLNPRRSYDSLLDSKTDRSWLPITRYPIAGTNALYEYDPNKSTPDVVYTNAGDRPSEPKASEEPSGSKIRKTEIVLPLFNGLPLAICTETVSSAENVAEDAINFIRSNLNRFGPLQSEDNASSDNSFVSNEGSDVTSSSETSSEDFVFYEGPREKDTLTRQSGLGNLYTISENSELSDLTASDPSSPQPSQHPSLQVLEQKRDRSRDVLPGHKEKSGEVRGLNKDYTVGVHILRNPLLSDLELQERVSKSSCSLQDYNHNKYSPDGFGACPRPDGECCGYYPDAQTFDAKKGEDGLRQSSGNEPGPSNSADPTANPPDTPLKDTETSSSGKHSARSENDKSHHKKRSHPGEKQTKKVNWLDVQSQSQRQFLNFNILGSSKQTPFSIDSNMFGEKKQTSEAKFPSEDSITFVFMGPNRQKTSVLMEIIKRSLGQGSSSDASLTEKSHRRSRNRGVQCKLMRSVSVDTAMIALSRFAKHQRPVSDIPRTSSLDTLVPEEMQVILEQGRLHGVRESGCQCDLGRENASECQCRKSRVVKYTICTSTTRDQGTETEKCLDVTDKSSMTSSLVDASCDALTDDNLFEDFFPPLPRRKLSAGASHEGWKDMKEVILGTSGYLDDEEDKPKRARKAKKSVSWSDLSECAESVEGKSDQSDLYATAGDEKSNCDSSCQSPPPDYVSHTRRVRFTEPQQSCLDGICHMLNENNEATQTAVNVTAFLKEAVQLLKNLNHLSQIYDLGEESWQRKTGVKSSLKKVETSVQTEGQPGQRTKDISLSAESSPIRRAKTSSALADRRERKASLNLTWPRQRPAALGKPPTGLKSSSVLKPSRSPLPFRPHSSQSTSTPSFDVLKNDIESSSTSTNWNISNLSTAFSNSYFGDSAGSRPSSSKSFYSDGIRGEKPTDVSSRHWTRSHTKILSPRPPKLNLDLEMDLEDSCRRLELAVERDRIREENSSIKLSSLNTRRRAPINWYFTPFEVGDRFVGSDTEMEDTRTKKPGKEGSETNFKRTAGYHFGAGKTLERKINAYVRRKPCKCYCHYRNNKVYRSSLELEAHLPVDRHCHACCTPCDAAEPERSNSAPALNSICDSDDNKCRLFYYGYCPCSPVKLQHVKSSPRAYMQHLLSLRRQIVKKTYDTVNDT